MTSNRGKQPSEHEDQTDRKKKKMFAGYILNKFVWNGFDVYNKWWEKSEGCLVLFKSWNWELNSCWYTWIISAYFLVWVGFSILRVKTHARLFECHWYSHNQTVFSDAFILLWAHYWFCVPLCFLIHFTHHSFDMVIYGCLRHTCKYYQVQQETELCRLPALQPNDQQQRSAMFWAWGPNRQSRLHCE